MLKKKYDWVEFFSIRNLLIRDLLIWGLILTIFLIFKEYPSHLKGIELVCYFIQMMLLFAVPCYTNNLIIIPLFRSKRYVYGIISYMIQVIILSLLLPVFFNFISWVFIKFFEIENWINWSNENVSFNIVAFSIMATVAKTAKDNLILKREQKASELKHLKNQLNPHFLFNTLNNLYGLSVVKSDKLPPLMLKLSGLLRYSVYDTEQSYVQLEKELTYLENYVELETIRLDENVDIKFSLSGKTVNQQIVPLILIVFIENAFKHFSCKKEKQGFITIMLDVNKNNLNLSVKNSINLNLSGDKNIDKGIGLTNVQRRLDMLYPGKYELEIANTQDLFEVQLNLDLS